eukprot:scaffold60862_cov41-Cyclotella_meneghiniana.AAC.4
MGHLLSVGWEMRQCRLGEVNRTVDNHPFVTWSWIGAGVGLGLENLPCGFFDSSSEALPVEAAEA